MREVRAALAAGAVLVGLLVGVLAVSQQQVDAATVSMSVRPRDLLQLGDMANPVDLVSPADMAEAGGGGGGGLSYNGVACSFTPTAPVAGDNSTITPSTTFTVSLIEDPPQGSGFVPPIGTATPTESGLAPAMIVNAPNSQCPTLLGRMIPSVTFPRNTSVRQLEAYWLPQAGGSTRLPVIEVTQHPTEWKMNDEGHSYGPQMIPFNTPLFALGALIESRYGHAYSSGGVVYTPRVAGAIRVRHVVSGANTSRSIVVSSLDVTINVATDGSGDPAGTETASAIAAAVNADANASPLVLASAMGDGSYPVGPAGYQSVPAAGDGTMEFRGYDATNHLIWKVPVSGLKIALPPAPVSNGTIQATNHPRWLLNSTRLARAAAKIVANDAQAQAYVAARDWFLAEWDSPNHDPSSASFQLQVDNPGAYAGVLALCYQLDKNSNPTRAAKCAAAGKAISAWRLSVSAAVTGGVHEEWTYDTCYRMRSHYQDQLLLYDWLYDQFSSQERKDIRDNLIAWVQYYLDPTHGCYSISTPPNNYYPALMWGVASAGIVFNGEDAAAAGLLTTLRTKLIEEQGILNQRACGGVWLEGTNYDGDSMVSDLQVLAGLRDYGEDWSDVFEALAPRALVYQYGVTRDGSLHLPFGGVSGNRPDNLEPSLLAMLQTESPFGPFGTRLYNALVGITNDFNPVRQPNWMDVLFGDVTQSTSAPSELSCVATGAGRAYSVSSTTIAAGSTEYTVAMESQHAGFDHYGYANGDVRFYKGNTCILCSSTYRRANGCSFDGQEQTQAFSTFMANGSVQSEYNRNRNNRWLFALEQPTWAAWGVDITSSMLPSSSDPYDEYYIENLLGKGTPVDFLIREVVHLRPGVLVVRNIHKRSNGSDSLVSTYQLGPSSGGTAVGGGVYTIGGFTIATYAAPSFSSVAFADALDAGCVVGRKMVITYPATTSEIEDIEVFSDTGVTISSYSGGVLHLSNSKCVTFGGGTVSVSSC